MNGGRELAAAILIVLFPTVPACVYLGSALIRRRRVGRDEVVTGRRSDTPFVVINWVSAVIGVTVLLGVGITLLARAIA